ncbi:MAG: FAD:protein FMN transferase [Gammaproteobacteria bacterium]|nr:FAD:protein FMN transferase [Gammaproteobacteria bacterium]
MTTQFTLTRINDIWLGQFTAMASPCEVLIATQDRKIASQVTEIACNEAHRIEEKFSRYRDNNIIFKINNANGATVEVDNETADMLDFADQCYQLSNGRFDITSGILREVWSFDGSDRVPEPEQVKAMLPRIGWNRVIWQRPCITLPPGMEIDLGGLGKEYAVDHTASLIKPLLDTGVLINYGGDIFTNGPGENNKPWIIGIDDAHATGEKARGQIELSKGGLATSGNARRYLLKNGNRYSHILDPQTGWPVSDPPSSVTVIAPSCIQAGILSTLAILQGRNAEQFLQTQQVQYYCQH